MDSSDFVSMGTGILSSKQHTYKWTSEHKCPLKVPRGQAAGTKAGERSPRLV